MGPADIVHWILVGGLLVMVMTVTLLIVIDGGPVR